LLAVRGTEANLRAFFQKRSTGAPASVARWKRRSYVVIAALFLTLLVIALAASWAAIELVNDTRAYATGEGRFSKAEKMAVLDM
jgi:hypothetical protein